MHGLFDTELLLQQRQFQKATTSASVKKIGSWWTRMSVVATQCIAAPKKKSLGTERPTRERHEKTP